MSGSGLPTNSLEMETTQNVSWNAALEEVTRTVGENSQGYKFMHIKAARSNLKRYEFLMYMSIFLGPLSAVISGVGMSLQPDPPAVFDIISSIIAFIAGIFTAIVKFGKFDQSAISHKLAASKYTSLESNVRRQLTLPRNVRIASVNYISWLNTVYDELFISSPLIPDRIVSDYERSNMHTGISTPTKQNNVILINTDYEQDTITALTNNNAIQINKQHSNQQLEAEKEPSPEENEALSNTNNIKRTGSFIPFTELNQYSDGMMNYEMKRLIGFK
jgi:hypothetical protein